MKSILSSLALVALVAATAARAHGTVHTAAETAVSAAAEVRGSHDGAYPDLANPRQVASLPWGDLIAFSGPRFADVPSFERFGLHLDGLPQTDCVPFITQVAGHFEDVWIADADPQAVGGSVYTDGHLDHLKLAHACRAHERLGFDLITH